MELEQLKRLIPEYSRRSYIMDRCFMWVLLQVKLLIEEINEYGDILVEGDYQQIQIRLMRRESKACSIRGRIRNIIHELENEIRMIETGVLVDGEHFKVKNKEKDISFRKELLEGFKMLMKRFEGEGMSEVDKLKFENAQLKKRVEELERR